MSIAREDFTLQIALHDMNGSRAGHVHMTIQVDEAVVPPDKAFVDALMKMAVDHISVSRTR